MNKDVEIQLGSTKNVDSVNSDTYTNVKLDNNVNKLVEYDINNILSVTEVFESERQNTEVYRIYGSIDYISQLHGMKSNYETIYDFFIYGKCDYGKLCDYKTLLSDFRFFLVRPSSTLTYNYADGIHTHRYFEVIATSDDFEIVEAGFSRNIYGDQKYCFSIKRDFDISGIVDVHGMLLTDFYIYAEYIPKEVPYGNEKMEKYNWGDKWYAFTPKDLEIGDHIYGDVIIVDYENYTQTVVNELTYRIEMPYNYSVSANNGAGTRGVIWTYKPLIPLKLQYLSDNLSRANTGNTSYDVVNSIPYFAIDLGDGNFVWRDKLDQGYIDPITGNGVDYPFVNKRRYLFNNITLSVVPDLAAHWLTNDIFKNLKFSVPTEQNKNVTTPLDEIGKPC